MNTKIKIVLQAIVASAVLLTVPDAIAKGYTKAGCIEEMYKSAASQRRNLSGEAVRIDKYCTCAASNQYKLSRSTISSYCLGIADSHAPKRTTAPRQPSPVEKAVDEFIQRSILDSLLNR